MQDGSIPPDPALGIRPGLLKWMEQARIDRFQARDLAEAQAWQRKARRTFSKLLGPAPQRVPLNPRVLHEAQLDGYRRLTLTLDTAPHLRALAWLCIPDGVSAAHPAPAMVATPGHGIGARDLLAMDAAGRPRPEGQGYQKDYALQAVRLGYVTLVVEPLGFGERRDPAMKAAKSAEIGCQAAFALALMLGTTLARLRLNDLQRGVDFLQARPEVRGERIGLMGISGGGQMTLWAAALEPRFQAAVVSGYFNRFKDSVMGMHHCICNFIPAAARHFDMPDLLAMAAPRPVLIESGSTDPIFPIAATRSALREARAIYRVWDARERVQADLFEGDHQWSGRKLAGFLKKWL